MRSAPARARRARRVVGVSLLAWLAVTGLQGCGARGPSDAAEAGDGTETDDYTPLPGQWYTVAAGDSLSAIAARYAVAIEDLEELNGLVDPGRLEVGQSLFLYGVEHLIQRRAQPASPKGTGKRSGGSRFAWPMRVGRVSSRFGYRPRFKRMHGGLDIAAATGTPIFAAAAGTVIYSDDGMRGYGNVVLIDHGEGLVTLYAHNSENLVDEGDRVVQGALIAKVGNTGQSTGPHLHFEVRVSGRTEDPELHLPKRR